MGYKEIEWRRQHGYDTDKASDDSAQGNFGESMTIQSQAEDADINVMLKRFGVTGQMPQGVRTPEYGDFTTVTDFRSAVHAVMQAEDSFMAMPAETRERFKNDPQLFLEFCGDSKNVLEMEKLGLTGSMIETEKLKARLASEREAEINAEILKRNAKSS